MKAFEGVGREPSGPASEVQEPALHGPHAPKGQPMGQAATALAPPPKGPACWVRWMGALAPTLEPHLPVLALAQALYWGCAIIAIALTALAGQALSPWPMLATLPLSVLIVGNWLCIGPLARWMQRHGRASGLRWGAVAGVAAGVLAMGAFGLHSFALLCVAMLLLGAYQASASFYRFAALDGVNPQRKGRALAWVLGGGIVAAVLAPTLAQHALTWSAVPMLGAYGALAGLAAVAWGLLWMLPSPAGVVQPAHSPAAVPVMQGGQNGAASSAPMGVPGARMLWQRPGIRLAVGFTALGHGLMILVMNATPLAMHAHGHGVPASTQVIQWHVLGMFLPSLLAGWAVDKLGAQRVALAGMGLLAASAGMAQLGVSQGWFLFSSLALGAGWNALMLAGTSLLPQAHAPHEQAAAQSLMERVNAGLAALMSLGCGVLVQTLGWQAINLAMLGVLALVGAWLWQVRRGLARTDF